MTIEKNINFFVDAASKLGFLEAVNKYGGWRSFGDDWMINQKTGMLSSSAANVLDNPAGEITLEQYNDKFKEYKRLNPYKNANTGWIWDSDKNAYFWPSKIETDADVYSRHLRPGETNKKKHAGVFSAIGTAIGTYLCPGIGTAIGAWMGSALDGVNDPKQLATSSAIAGATAYVGSQLDLGSLFGLSGSTTPSGMNPYNSYIMGGNNAAAGNLAYGNASNLGTFTPELGLMSSSMAPLSSYTAGEAASIVTDRELQYILNDMQSALSSDYDPSLVAGLRDYELNHILTDMGDAVSPNYTGSTETPVQFSSGRPVGTAHTLKGRSFDPYSGEDRGYWYDVDRMAPEEPTLDYPYPDPNNPTEPMYNESGMYDYTLPSEFDPNDLVTSSSGSWKDYLEDFLKVLKGLKIGGGTEGTPGYIKSWFGGSGLGMPGDGYYPNRSKGRRDLGMEMLEGTDLDLDKILNPYLEDYVYAGR